MTKAEIVKQIAGQTGLESKMVAGVVEALLERIRAAQILSLIHISEPTRH